EPHRDAHRNLEQFAEQAGLLPKIQLNTRFVDAEKSDRGTWIATLRSNETNDDAEREFRAIVIATGSHNKNHRSVPQRLWDEAAGSGMDVIHSADYADAAPYAGKRVLVVGIGNSGTDIADKVSAVAKRTLLAVRTPPWINPAAILGTPCDKMAVDSTWLPHWYQMASFHLIRRLAIGPLSRLGLSTPRHRLLDCVPVTDRGVVRAILDGRVTVRSNVESLTGGVARFEDAQQTDEPVDAVIFATGFARQYPLLPPLDADGEALDDLLTFFIFRRTEPGLAFMTEVVGTWSCWPIFVEQARAIAAYFAAEQRGGRHVRRFNTRRNVPLPNFKGKLFGGANAYHIDYALYTRALRELTAWLSE
ncbi:MAG: FAD-dependent oxidoreductase, partial [Planctomycetaceae bacterium]